MLRRPVRLSAEHGAKMYATVEHVVYGYATVRLASNGARLTNVAVLGADVAIGDRVVVDYSAEGKPYVRPLTIPYPQPGIDEGSANTQEIETDPYDYGIEIARITIGSQYTAQTGWNCGAGCVPIPHYVKFNTAIYDPAGMFGTDIIDGHGYLQPHSPGRYLIRWSCAVSEPMEPQGSHLRISCNLDNGKFLGGPRWRRWFTHGSGNWMLVGGSIIMTLYNSDTERVAVRIAPEWGGWSAETGDDNSTYTILQASGKYPILEMYKICNLGSGPQARREWYL